MKDKMEEIEVLAPQVVLPVAAVVICALLVFMFGFKHAPEPSFDYDSSEEKRPKKQKLKKVSNSSVLLLFSRRANFIYIHGNILSVFQAMCAFSYRPQPIIIGNCKCVR